MPDCEYFNRKSAESKSITGFFDAKHVICDNYGCPANGGKFLSAELDLTIGFCDADGLKAKLDELKKPQN